MHRNRAVGLRREDVVDSTCKRGEIECRISRPAAELLRQDRPTDDVVYRQIYERTPLRLDAIEAVGAGVGADRKTDGVGCEDARDLQLKS